jgi:hypothetical protein
MARPCCTRTRTSIALVASSLVFERDELAAYAAELVINSATHITP